jgi:uncharacterized protein (TIGR02271 family)
MSEMTVQGLDELRDAPVYDSTGDQIGKVEEIFYNQDTDQPELLGIGTGFFGTKRVIVPLAGARVEADSVSLAYDKDLVKESPDIDSDELSDETVQQLYAYYGLGGGAPTAVPAEGDASVTRSEEELQVGKREVDAGSVRLRKWVVTEPAQADVELQREQAHVTREAIDEPVDADAMGEDEIEVPLRAEQAVVQKQVVAKERIAVEKDVETERQTVSDELRKEQVEVEGADERG